MLNKEFVNLLLKAAKLIEEDGAEGLISASEIVGIEAAAGLLIGSLVAGYNHERIYPMPSDIPEKITNVLNEKNLIKE